MANINKIIIILAFFTFFLKGVVAQSDDMRYNLIELPPAPNSSSLGKLTEVSANLSTGTLPTSIPLINISEGGVDLDIALNYSGGGIKVNEESSWVGLGWSLTSGGMITRSIRGLPDDQPGGYLHNCQNVPVKENITLDLMNSDIRFETYQFLNRVSNNLLDYEPDIFYFSLNDVNGNFVFNNVFQPVCIPYKAVKIEPIYDGNLISGIYVTDPKGLIYFFGDTITNSLFVEKTIVNNEGWDIPPYISTWLLKEIINPFTNEIIKYNYIQHNISTYNNHSIYSKYYNNKYQVNKFIVASTDNSSRNIATYTRYLDFIDVNGEKIYFKSSIGLDQKVVLDSILYKKRTIIFNHDYFKVSPNSTNEDEIRLKLESLVQRSEYDYKTIEHKFKYYENNKLPSKNSYSIDSMGYYNGKTNETAIPKLPIEFDINFIVDSVFQPYHVKDTIGDANRSPDWSHAQSYSLKKIIYPTGGSTDFIYEGNTIARFPKISEIGSFNSIGVEVSDPTGNGYYYDTAILVLDELKKYTNFQLQTLIEFSEPEQPHWGAYVRLKNLALNKIIYSHTYTADTNNSPPHTVLFDDSLFQSSSSFELIVRLNRAVSATLYSNLIYKEYDPSELTVLRDYPACGIRIKSIIDSVENRSHITNYDYSLSGYITNPFKKSAIYGYVKEWEQSIDEMPGALLIYNNIMLFTNPIGGLGTNDNSIAYSKVSEFDGSNNGSTIYYFNKTTDQDFSNVNLAPLVSQQYLRELLIQKEFYDKDKYLVKKYIYVYDVDTSQNELVMSFRATRVGTLIGVQISYEDYESAFNYGNYFYNIINKNLSKSKEISYNNHDSLIIEKNFFYDSFYINNITKIIEQNSNGNIIETDFKYPSDYIPFYNKCKINFMNDMHECYNAYPSCAIELQSCFDIYNSINAPYQACITKAMAMKRYHLREAELFKAARSECFNSYNNDFYTYYMPCIEAYSCDYLKCRSQAIFDFQKCQNEYNDYLLDLFITTTDPNLKSIYLYALFNFNNLLIEKSITCNGNLISKEEKKFRLFIENQDTLPVLDRIIDGLAIEGLKERIVMDKTDKFSNILQNTVATVNTSNIYGYNNSKYLIAQIQNSTFEECGYTGFENKELNDWTKYPNNLFDDHEFFTGASSISVVDSSCGPTKDFNVGMQAANHNGYQASVWVKGSKNAYLHIEANGWSIHERTHNDEGSDDWHLLKVILYRHQYESVIDSTLKIRVYVGVEGKELAHFDDLRFYPLDAQMTTYTYIPLIGTSSISDNNNKPTKYEYDSFGRLTHIRDFQDNILKKYDYHYKP